jgi:hypothetical protein
MKKFLTSIMMLLSFSVTVFGLGMEIRSPQIGCPRNLDAKMQETLHEVIEYMGKELSLIEGSFLNEYSQQRFGATSIQTSAFIKQLRNAGIWQINIVFRDYGEQESAFTLAQSSPESVRLVINSGREDFRLVDFEEFLPKVEVPNTKESEARQVGTDQPASALESKPEGNQNPEPDSEARP